MNKMWGGMWRNCFNPRLIPHEHPCMPWVWGRGVFIRGAAASWRRERLADDIDELVDRFVTWELQSTCQMLMSEEAST